MIFAINRETKEHIRVPYALDGDATWSYIEADRDGWIPWEGGECPLPCAAMCNVKESCPELPVDKDASLRANAAFWGAGTTIKAYRPILDAEREPEAPAWDGESWPPPIGCELESFANDGDGVRAEVLAVRNGHVIGCAVDTAVAGWLLRDECRPIRSEEERAVEAMLGRTRCTVPEEHARMICRDLYRDGYRKEPTNG